MKIPSTYSPTIHSRMEVNFISLGGGGEGRSINMYMLWVDSLLFPSSNQQYIYTQINGINGITLTVYRLICFHFVVVLQFGSFCFFLFLFFCVAKDMFINIKHNYLSFQENPKKCFLWIRSVYLNFRHWNFSHRRNPFALKGRREAFLSPNFYSGKSYLSKMTVFTF